MYKYLLDLDGAERKLEIAYQNDFPIISLHAKNINGIYSKWGDASLQIAYNKIYSRGFGIGCDAIKTYRI